MTENKCEKCGKEFNSEEGLNMHMKAKHSVEKKAPLGVSKETKRKIRNWVIAIIIIGGLTYAVIFGVSNQRILPPTDMQGHIEENPVSHVLKEPMPILIQKHMLEHADGTGRPGVIINYNCIDFACSDNLIPKLEAFADDYDYVYVAPFDKMSEKIVLTKLGRLDILEEYDEQKINNFI